MQVNVNVTNRTTTTRIATSIITNMITWIPLVSIVTLSELWLGGSWVIDFVALWIMFLAIFLWTRFILGYEIHLTKEETRLWVLDGMPDNVKEWKNKLA